LSFVAHSVQALRTSKSVVLIRKTTGLSLSMGSALQSPFVFVRYGYCKTLDAKSRSRSRTRLALSIPQPGRRLAGHLV